MSWKLFPSIPLIYILSSPICKRTHAHITEMISCHYVSEMSPFQHTPLSQRRTWHGRCWEVLFHRHFPAIWSGLPSVDCPKPVLHHGPALRLCVAYHQRTQDQHPSSRESDALAIFPLPLLCSHVWSLQHGAGDGDWYNSSEVYSVSFLLLYQTFQVLVFLQQHDVGTLPLLVGLCMLPRIWRWYLNLRMIFPRKVFLYIRSNKTYQVQSTISSPGAVGVQLQR